MMLRNSSKWSHVVCSSRIACQSCCTYLHEYRTFASWIFVPQRFAPEKNVNMKICLSTEIQPHRRLLSSTQSDIKARCCCESPEYVVFGGGELPVGKSPGLILAHHINQTPQELLFPVGLPHHPYSV